MDIVSDGFGFMLAYGDLAWVPFTFSMHARYLLHNPVHLHPAALAALVLLFVAGFTIFRASNSQKDAFRRDPNAPQFKGTTHPTHTPFLWLLMLGCGFWAGRRLALHPNQARHQAAGVRVLGLVSPRKLPRRLAALAQLGSRLW